MLAEMISHSFHSTQSSSIPDDLLPTIHFEFPDEFDFQVNFTSPYIIQNNLPSEQYKKSFTESSLEHPDQTFTHGLNSGYDDAGILLLCKNARKILPSDEINRFLEFICYEDGWYFGQGLSLKSDSIRAMNKFFQEAPSDFFAAPPSIFMTREGHLSLVWETNSDNAVEVEFFENHIEYYIEELDLEGSLPLNDMQTCIKTILSLKHA